VALATQVLAGAAISNARPHTGASDGAVTPTAVASSGRAKRAVRSSSVAPVVSQAAAELLDALAVPAAQFSMTSGELLHGNPAFCAAFCATVSVGSLDHLGVLLGYPLLTRLCVDAGQETLFVDVGHTESKRHFHLAGRRDEKLSIVTLTLLDITDRIRIEQNHREHQTQLFYASKVMSVGEMAAVISHELNHPLATCMNFLGGIRQRLSVGGESEQKLLAPLDTARDQVARAVEIVSRIREFVKSREPKYESFALDELFVNLGDWLRLDLAKYQIAYQIDLPKDLPLVSADRVMLLQVLVNLAKNAVEVLQNPSLSRRELRVGAQRDSTKNLAIWVADSGGGVPTDAQPRLFAPFTSTKTQGMGIGLSICRSIVEFHGGRLWHEPTQLGAKFIFTLPCEDVAHAHP
jgi:C4-dicarboxylate-specific signal transduction histidine kinase